MKNGMDNMMEGCGLMCSGMWVIGLLVFIVLVLLIIWLVRQTKK